MCGALAHISSLAWPAFETFENRLNGHYAPIFSPFNISGTPEVSALKFLGLVETIDVCCWKCSKFGLPLNLSPKFVL